MLPRAGRAVVLTVLLIGPAGAAFGQTAGAALTGRVVDQTGAALPGVLVEWRADNRVSKTVSDATGRYAFTGLGPGTYTVTWQLPSFAVVARTVTMTDRSLTIDVELRLTLNADVTVTGANPFENLADVRDPAVDLVGIAQAASQGAVTAREIQDRPLMRTGEVMEAVPGLIVTQHSGEGKANQYFLRGFNLDHGTDFAQTAVGMPVNMPSNAHGQGYSDLNFLIPELISGVQYSKGPYYANQGDFATAGAANINYVNTLDRPVVVLQGGGEGYGRLLAAGSRGVGAGHLLAAAEGDTNGGPWTLPDDYHKLDAVVRYSRGDAVNGLSLTAMGYHGTWRSTDQIPTRAVAEDLLGRFGAIDPTDGGSSSRYSVSGAWQRGGGGASTTVSAYGLAYRMNLFSNFTYFLDDPVHGDQIEQLDRRIVSGASVSHERVGVWAGRPVDTTVGVQLRNDDIGTLGLFHTQARTRLSTDSLDRIVETNLGLYVQSEVLWAPWLRTMLGARLDVDRFRVADEQAPVNSGTRRQALASPKGGFIAGPWKKTEFYVDAGSGYHSNDARGTTLVRDPEGNPVEPVTPMVRAVGEEIGIRTVAVPRLQSTLSLWALHLDSELVFDGDEGTTEPSLPSRRHGLEWATYYRAAPHVVLDADLSWSHATFTDGTYVPEAVDVVASAGATLEAFRGWSGDVRWRYFGPRNLVDDGSVRSKATSLVDLHAGRRLTARVSAALDVFNVLNQMGDDIDYYYASRLPGEPAGGIDDLEFHPTPPRTARVTLNWVF